MNDKPLTIGEAMDAFPDNPQAKALAVGMVLLQGSHEEVNRINSIIEKSDKEQIEELEVELAYWKPLGKKWLKLKTLLAPDPEPLA